MEILQFLLVLNENCFYVYVCQNLILQMIKYAFVLFVFLFFNLGFTLRQSCENHQGAESLTIQQKLIKVKQLKYFLEDPDINSLLKMNPQIYKNNLLGIFENPLNQQQTTMLTQTKNLIGKWEECPSQKPYYDGLICVSCSKDQTFDLATQKCARCKSGNIYDTKKKQCVNKSTNFNIALTQMDRERAQEIIIIRANHIADNLMSFVVEKTQRLKARLVFDQSTSQNKTHLSPNATNPHFLNLVLLSGAQSIDQFQLEKQDVPCPKQKPFYNGNQCISCDYPTHLFDATTKWCVKCSNNFIYSVKTHQCVKLQKNQQKKNL